MDVQRLPILRVSPTLLGDALKYSDHKKFINSFYGSLNYYNLLLEKIYRHVFGLDVC